MRATSGAQRVIGVRAASLLIAAALRAQEPAPVPGQAVIMTDTVPAVAGNVTVPLALSVSGSISLGSYQAGVTWAMIEFYRRATHDSAYRSTHRLNRFSLASVAGASAGDINGIIAAIEWCRVGERRSPEESLFWRMWMPVGLTQLRASRSDLDNPEDRGLFTRAFLRDRVYGEIERDMAATRSAGCDIPIGMTLTRVYPDTFHAGGIVVPVQRFAAVFRLTSSGPSGGLRFAQAKAAVRTARPLGLLISPVVPNPDSIPVRTIMAIVEASAAVPLAFAPRELRFYPSATLDADGGCPRGNAGACAEAQLAQFVDGGIFDNIPMSLAIGMYARTRPAAARTPLIVGYVDPFILRGRLDSIRASRLPERPLYGVSAVSRLLRGAIPVARKYELFGFGRAIADSAASQGNTAYPRPTSRAYPIVGEHLGAFAAFLGRPFREFDFYGGAYDRMHFVAKEHLCSHPQATSAARGATDARGREEDPDECMRRRMQELLSGDHLRLSAVAREVMAYQYEADFGAQPLVTSASRTDEERNRALVLTSIARANRELFRPPEQCPGTHLIEQFFCTKGFNTFMQHFDSDPVRAIVELWAEDCTDLRSARGECMADTAMVALMRGRERYLDRLTDGLLRQLWEVESHADRSFRRGVDSVRTSYVGTVQATHFAYRSSAEHYRRGLELDPSTIPDAENGKVRGAFALLPYHLSGGLGTRSIELGWRPTLYLGRRLAVVVPLDAADLKGPDDDHAVVGSAGIGVYGMRQSLLLSGVQLSVFASGPLEHRSGVRWDPSARTVGGELALYIGAGKLRLSVRTVPSALRRTMQDKTVVGAVGVADFNGMLYWLFR